MKTKIMMILFFISNYAIGQGYWNVTPNIKADGVMEIGKYLDFHESNNDTKDYSVRLYANNGSLEIYSDLLKLRGSLNADGALTAKSLFLNDPNSVSDYNILWQTGFYEGYNKVNAPETNAWFWGINMGHSSNREDYKYNGQLVIKNSSTTPTMYFRSTNKDGIGTWAKVLHNQGNQSINGNLTLDGKLNCEEVKVEIINGADYVFDEEYELKELSELESYLKENKHLPEVQSAAEMETDGIELAKMNILMLKKIEELTLYTIEQENKIDDQSKKINKLESAISKQSDILKRIEILEKK